MSVLVLNAGSSSLKFMVCQNTKKALRGRIEKIGSASCRMIFDNQTTAMPNASMATALTQALKVLPLDDIQGVGHRVVHGGMDFTGPVLVTEGTLEKIRQLIPLAPLHNPGSLAGIEAVRQALPNLADRNVACFDTAFHSTMPPVAYTYAVPWQMARDLSIRRYGFHGLSVEYVCQRACELLGLNPRASHILVCHLGAGCSATAVKDGVSVDTSMGLTPLDGLVMGTRTGSVDPGLLSYIKARTDMGDEEITSLFNNESGLLGVSGTSSDMRTVLEKATSGATQEERQRCVLARDVFVHRVCQTMAMLWVDIARMDCLVFTGGIGENSAEIRRRIVRKWNYRGILLDHDLNERPGFEGIISEDRSSVQVAVVKTNEELQIARHARRLLGLAEGPAAAA